MWLGFWLAIVVAGLALAIVSLQKLEENNQQRARVRSAAPSAVTLNGEDTSMLAYDLVSMVELIAHDEGIEVRSFPVGTPNFPNAPAREDFLIPYDHVVIYGNSPALPSLAVGRNHELYLTVSPFDPAKKRALGKADLLGPLDAYLYGNRMNRLTLERLQHQRELWLSRAIGAAIVFLLAAISLIRTKRQ